MSTKKMMTGAGSYFQGENALDEIGPEISRLGDGKALIIGGEKALAAASGKMLKSLETSSVNFEISVFHGFCTDAEIEFYASEAGRINADCIIGVGGGKAVDVSKAVAAAYAVPVFTVPTCAATCAAYASLSVIYNEAGCQVHTIYHKDEVRGVFADTSVLAKSPARYLAAGMADAMAKSCEYSSMRKSLKYGDVDISKYLGYKMAVAADEVLLICGRTAYEDNLKGTVSQALEDALFCTIASTGTISGMGGFGGRTGSRFAIAHGFNEVIRGRYADTKKWLHGEIVGVGILAQLEANGADAEYIARVRDFYLSINVPVTLSDMGIVLSDEKFEVFTKEILEHSHVDEQYAGNVVRGVRFVR